MRRLNARTTSKVTVRLQHPVPLTLLPEYLSSAVARFVAVRSRCWSRRCRGSWSSRKEVASERHGTY